MKTVCLKQVAAFISALSFATAALAQYVWVDDRGVKQFSDMPPPASVPKTRIVRQPSAMQSASAVDKNAKSADAPAETLKSAAPMTSAEKNTDFMKRRNEQAEKDKKATDEAKRKADTAQNCERARGYAQSLENGQRVTRTDSNGERAFLSDEERAGELQNAKRIVADCR